MTINQFKMNNTNYTLWCSLFYKDEFVDTVRLTPKCGQDFCEQCGDCLYCYGEDECVITGNGHDWIKYLTDEEHQGLKNL